MNKLICFLLLYFTGHGLFAQYADYKFQREIKGVEDLWHTLVLPDEIYPYLKQDLRDIRVIGVTGKNDTIEAPYILDERATYSVYEEIDFSTINKTRTKTAYYYTFQLTEEKAINEINLDFKRNNFDWKVKLEGSHDQKEWYTITSDYRIASLQNEITDYSFTKLTFPNANFEFFRLQIPTSRNPRLKSAKLVHKKVEEGVLKKYAVKQLDIKEDEKRNVTVVYGKLNKSFRISKIKIKVKDEYDYYRKVTFSYLKDSTKTETAWLYNYETLAYGTLNSLGNNEFDIKSTTLNNIKIKIENKQNEPLEINLVEVIGYANEMNIRFTKPATYYLCYGNKNTSRPTYDIERFTDRIPEDLTAISLGAQTTRHEIINTPEKQLISKYWLWAIMLVVIALLAYFALRMLKEDKK